MPKISINAPPLIMGGNLNINSTVRFVTKAKLDSISVQAGCSCPEDEASLICSSESETSSISDDCVEIIKDIEADLAYLVDRSDSISRDTWETIKTFLAESITELTEVELANIKGK